MSKTLTFANINHLILTSRPPENMQTRIVAIDGCGGAGKSTLAQALSRHLTDCPVIHTDDFASWDNSAAWYPRMIEQVLLPLRDNKSTKFQKYDWNKRELADWIHISPSEIIIVEGVSSTRQEFRSFLTFSIFVRTARELRLKRGLERDGQKALNLWEQWMRQEDEYVARDEPEKFADIIIDGEFSDYKSEKLLVFDR